MIKHVKGDLLTLAKAGKFDIIVHGCNCQNTMGSGIAAQIKAQYPEAFQADWEYDQQMARRRYNKLGNFTWASTSDGFKIINAYTQFHYLPRNVDHFEYASFKLILQKLVYYYGNYDFGLPYIGMGLAGGDKFRIQQLLDEFAVEIDKRAGSVTLVEYSA